MAGPGESMVNKAMPLLKELTEIYTVVQQMQCAKCKEKLRGPCKITEEARPSRGVGSLEVV